MGSILELLGGEYTDEKLQEIVQARRRDITAIMEEAVEESKSPKVSLAKKVKTSKASEDMF